MQLSLLPLLLCDGTAAGTHLTLSVHIRPESFSISYLFCLPLFCMQLSKNTHWITPVRENRVWFFLLGLAQMPAPLARNFVSSPSVCYERLTYLKTESDFEGGVGLTGLEPVTLRLSSACSNQLSYRPGSRG